jgi:hypothetical protein
LAEPVADPAGVWFDRHGRKEFKEGKSSRAGVQESDS